MKYTAEQRKRIWKSTNGRCHLTGRRLKLADYGTTWEIDHSRPRARGGSDHANNLKPATITANRAKQAASSRAVRRRHGLSRSPMSPAERSRTKSRRALGGAVAGAALAAAVLGPPGLFFGAAVGALFGHSGKPE